MDSAHTSKSSSTHETTPTKANGSNTISNNNNSSNGNNGQQSNPPPLPISVNIVDAPKTPAATSPPVKSANSSTSLGKGDETTSTASSVKSSGSRFSLKNLFKGKKKDSNPILSAAAASAPVNVSNSFHNTTPSSTPPIDERASQQSTASKSKSRFSWGSSKKNESA